MEGQQRGCAVWTKWNGRPCLDRPLSAEEVAETPKAAFQDELLISKGFLLFSSEVSFQTLWQESLYLLASRFSVKLSAPQRA